jgi:hypothetical protein
MKVLRPEDAGSFDRLADFYAARRQGLVHELNAVGNPLDRVGATPAPERASRFFRASELAGKPVPAREWLVPDLIPHRTVTLLSGDGGTGKSLLALQLAVAAATGGRWVGRETTEGSVLYLSAEDDATSCTAALRTSLTASGWASKTSTGSHSAASPAKTHSWHLPMGRDGPFLCRDHGGPSERPRLEGSSTISGRSRANDSRPVQTPARRRLRVALQGIAPLYDVQKYSAGDSAAEKSCRCRSAL